MGIVGDDTDEKKANLLVRIGEGVRIDQNGKKWLAHIIVSWGGGEIGLKG